MEMGVGVNAAGSANGDAGSDPLPYVTCCPRQPLVSLAHRGTSDGPMRRGIHWEGITRKVARAALKALLTSGCTVSCVTDRDTFPLAEYHDLPGDSHGYAQGSPRFRLWGF